MTRWLRHDHVALTQGAFYILTGLWPILHLKSFVAVTGPKPEAWLVKTTGGLIAVAGAAMMSAGLRRKVGPDILLLAAGSAAALAIADLWFAGATKRISPVYLADAAVELGIVGLWIVSEPAS